MLSLLSEKNIEDLTIEEIRQIISEIDNLNCSILHNNLNQQRVIAFGSSGVGKSTLLNLLLQHILFISKNDVDDIILTMKNGNETFPMGSEMASKTTIPSIIKHNNKLICDPAGENDTRGPVVDIINSFSINQLFSNPCKITILFVVSGNDLQITGGRGMNFQANLEKLCKMIPNENELKQCIGLVISKPEKSPEKYLKGLIKGNSNQFVVKWCEFFLKEIDYRVFCLPKSLKDQLGEEFRFPDFEKLQSFINSSYVSNPTHKISLSPKSFEKMNEICRDFPIFVECFEKIIKLMQEAINTVYDEKMLNDWTSFLNILKTKANTSDEFTSFIRNNISDSIIYEEHLSKIEFLDSLYSFKNQIVQYSHQTISSDIKKNLNKLLPQVFIIIDLKKNIFSLQNAQKIKEEMERRLSILENSKELNEQETRELKVKIEIKEQEMISINEKIREIETRYQNEIENLKEENNKHLVLIKNLEEENEDAKYDWIPFYGLGRKIINGMK